jgi:nucleoside-diphosphate-sugar epimerase
VTGSVLVSGAHGFIGSHLVDELLAAGRAVRGLVSPWGTLERLADAQAAGGLEIVRADITEPQSLKGVCDGIEAVVHAAARVADWGRWDAFERVNVGGTKALLAEAARAGVRRFVLVSSVAVHRYSGFREADPRSQPRDGGAMPYARSKILAEDAVLAAGLKGEVGGALGGALEGVVVRPGLWPFGPRDPNLARVAEALRRGALPLVDGGRAVINTACVGNLVRGLRLAVERPEAAGQVYVISDDGAPSWRELMDELARLLGCPAPRRSVPGALAVPVAAAVETAWRVLAPRREPPLTRYRAGLMRRDVHFSIEAARRELGYEPTVGWREGLAASVAALPGIDGR